jgi:hypothetical protein
VPAVVERAVPGTVCLLENLKGFSFKKRRHSLAPGTVALFTQTVIGANKGGVGITVQHVDAGALLVAYPTLGAKGKPDLRRTGALQETVA